MIPRGKIYISYKHLCTGMYYCIADRLKTTKQTVANQNGDTLICLSVRTGFDLVLSALNFSAGSEMLVTAINIPDMFKIIVGHNIIPIPLSVNKQTLNISPAQLEAAITPATRAILITHLFGGIMDTDELITIAQKHNLVIFEDCAQAYAGNIYQGNPASDVVMFSFGFIKTNTAISGAVIKIKDPLLLADVLARNEQYSRLTSAAYIKKLYKATLVKLLSNKTIYTGFYKLVKVARKDFDEVLASFTKGFPGDNIFELIRHRPCLPNKKLLQKKLSNFNQQHINSRVQLANDVFEKIPDHYKIGHLNKMNTYWVMPVETNDPARLINYLRNNGFDASQKASSLITLKLPDAVNNEYLDLDKLVYLPVYPAMSRSNRSKLSQLLIDFSSVK